MRVHYYDKEDAPSETTETGEDGTFRFPQHVGEKGVLLAEADGFRPGWFPMSNLAEVQLTLEPGEPLPYLVVDPEDKPIAGAEVEAWYKYPYKYFGDFTRGRFVTDASGVVEVNAGPGEQFTVTAPGFETLTVRHPERSDDMRFRTIVLRPLLRIAGRVVDPLGHPVANAQVCYRSTSREPWDEASEARVEGEARFETPPLDTEMTEKYEVRAFAEGWAEAIVSARPGDADVVLRLDRPATIDGCVFLPGGASAAGAELWANYSDPPVHSAADGTFRLEGITPGRVELVADWWGPVGGPDSSHETNWRCSWPFELKPGEIRTGVEVTLSGAHYSWVPLRLVDEKGAPLANVPVDTGSLSTLGEPRAEGDGTVDVRTMWRTNADGFVLIRTEDPPGYESTFEFPAKGTSLGIDRSCRIRTLPPGTMEVVTVKLAAPVRVTFVVRDENGALIPAEAAPTVYLDPGGEHPVSGDRVEALVVSDLDDDPRVEYRVRAIGFADVNVEDWVPSPAGETIAVRLKPGATLRGRVAAADGTPLENIQVACDGWGRLTDWRGEFEFDGLAPGPVLLCTSPERRLRRQVDLLAGVNDIGTLTSRPPETIRGSVSDTRGKPVGGVAIHLLEAGLPAEQPLAVTGPNGRFSFRSAEPKTVRVIARKRGFGAAIAAGDTDLEITLPEGGDARLRVPPEFESCRVEIALPDGSEIDPEYDDEDEPGVWRLVQLPPGPLTITFWSESGRIVATCTDRATVVRRW